MVADEGDSSHFRTLCVPPLSNAEPKRQAGRGDDSPRCFSRASASAQASVFLGSICSFDRPSSRMYGDHSADDCRPRTYSGRGGFRLPDVVQRAPIIHSILSHGRDLSSVSISKATVICARASCENRGFTAAHRRALGRQLMRLLRMWLSPKLTPVHKYPEPRVPQRAPNAKLPSTFLHFRDRIQRSKSHSADT